LIRIQYRPSRLTASEKLAKVDRLADVAVGAEAVAGELVAVLVGRAEDDDRQALEALVGRIWRRTSKPSMPAG